MAATIHAVSTAPGRAAVAVVRISGPQAHAAVAQLCAGHAPSPDRAMRLRRLRTPQGVVLDHALVVCFPQGASYTGEASAELHLHGGSAVVASVLTALGAMPGLRPAKPGEFSRRAFENGRLDLAQLEGVADLIDARTEAQRRQALRSADGALARQAAAWRTEMVGALALIEAGIDFADEALPDGLRAEADTRLRALADALAVERRGAEAAQALRDGFVVAIVGPPNVGKSTLFNALLRRDAAITSPVAGTTRDVLEAACDVGGLPVTLLDTAGLRESNDPVEMAGVARARDRAASADLRLIVHDPFTAPELAAMHPGDIVVMTKSDRQGVVPSDALAVCALTGEGMERLCRAIAAVLSTRLAEVGAVVNARQSAAIDAARDALLRACALPDELAAAEIRTAARALDSLIGRIDVEQVLDDIFGRFCLGK
jgi:tRNA modification GTPase